MAIRSPARGLEVEPFRAVRYAEGAPGGLSRRIAPPYDVISPAQRDALASRDPHNVVELILPQDRPGEDRYARAGRTWRQWLAEGVLREDAEPALYVLHQRFSWDGEPRLRRGFLARLRLREFADGVVLPHEKTLSGPKADRLALFQEVRANLSPIFSLYPDERGEVDALLAPAVDRLPDAAASGDDGHGPIENRLWRVGDPGVIGRVREAMAARRAYIADGHHRYETALNYAKQADARRPDPGAPHHFVLSYFCAMSDPGLLILPTHRLLHGLPGFELGRLLAAAGGEFTITPIQEDLKEEEGRSRALAALREAGERRPSFLAVDRGRAALLSLSPGLRLEGIVELPRSSEVRGLDVTLLHGLVFQRILGLSPASQERKENLDYVKDAAEAVAAVAAGTAQAAFLLNPTRMGQVRSVAEAGEAMPQKSTFFYPKLPSGLVFNPLVPLRA